MARLTSLILLTGGALILVVWLVAPADSAPPQMAGPVLGPTTASHPELDEIDRQIDRLTERLAAPDDAARPVRDPFQFADPVWHRADRAVDTSPVVVPSDPVIVWPQLIAILSSESQGAPTHQAAFEDDGHVIQILAAGASIDGFVVESVAADVVVVSDRATGRTRRLSLR